ncbi:Hypothetical_protein [Hexamita inflata]|uniref:Hypothetical_protein n=1 Tax=Hexamita inflata TaxID=28002 RepID=A0AA86PU96_9EUKA|nr:Hypothetical protein HINF_LOCUS31328 [Hexamita inflata]
MNLLYEYLYEQQVMVKLKQEQNTLYSNVLAPHQLQLSSTPAYQIQAHYAIFRGGINYTNDAETRQSRRRQCVGKVIFVHQISKFALYTVATSNSRHRFNQNASTMTLNGTWQIRFHVAAIQLALRIKQLLKYYYETPFYNKKLPKIRLILFGTKIDRMNRQSTILVSNLRKDQQNRFSALNIMLKCFLNLKT